ncbi:MAG: hypothetical protein BroJett033_0540 [Chloroflexota bacterium]|nr:MAG: hypothetical protein BroJett033_0540 [Chloroflexota bacterium]
MKFSKAVVLFLFAALLLALVGPGVTALAAPVEQQVQFATPIMVVNASFLNVRTGPGVQYSVLITVVGGTELPVLGRARDNVWFQVSTVVGVGWVNAEFTIPRGEFTNVPYVDFNLAEAVAAAPGAAVIGLPDGQGGGGAPAASGAPASGGIPFVAGTTADGKPIVVSPNERFRALINVEAVNLREQPFGAATPLTTLFRNDSFDYPIVGITRDSENVDWIALVAPEVGTGWVEAPKLTLRLSGAYHTVVVVVAQTIGMGDTPGTGSTHLPILTAGREGFLVGASRDGGYVQIELGGGETGWVPLNAVQTRSGTPTDGLNLTQQPPAAPGAGGGGVPVRPSLAVPHIVVNTSFLNVRSGPGAQFMPVATAAGGSEFSVVGRTPDGVWLLVQGPFGQGWVNQEFVVFRGVYDNVAIIPYASAAGVLATPTVVIGGPTVLYVAPGTNFGAAGTITGPAEVPIVARTADGTWVQVNTSLGFGWVLAAQVQLRGDISLIPVVG